MNTMEEKSSQSAYHVLFLALIMNLAGCSTRFYDTPYKPKDSDPLIFVQSTRFMPGTNTNFSLGTVFYGIYRDEKGNCQRSWRKSLGRPIKDEKIKNEIEKGKGIRLPANTFISITANFSEVRNLNPGFIISMMEETSCPRIVSSIFAEQNKKYLFEFSIISEKCILKAFQINPNGMKEPNLTLPFLMCEEKKNRSHENMENIK